MTTRGVMQALEACAQSITNYVLAVMHGVKAFALTLPFDKLRTSLYLRVTPRVDGLCIIK
jgi:hypothetical protein